MTDYHRSLRLALTYLIAALVLIGMFGLAGGSVQHKSLTWLESQPSNPVAWLGGSLEMPISAIPTAISRAESGQWTLASSDYNLDRYLFLSRFPVILLGLLLVALIFRWGRSVYGLWSGLIALALVATAPTIIAYGQLASPDLPAAAFSLAALYSWNRYLRTRRLHLGVSAGALLGLSLLFGFIALSLALALTIMTLWHVRLPQRDASRNRWWLLLPWAACAAVLLLSLIAASILFPGNPIEHVFGDLMPLAQNIPSGQRPYLFGRFSSDGWRYAYLALIAVKLTLPQLLLLALALVLTAMRGVKRQEWGYLFPAMTHLVAVSLLQPIPEIRHVLFVLPLIALFSARMGAAAFPGFSWRRMALTGLVAGAQIPACMGAYPYFLAFFNASVGGPENGYHVAAGSNLDAGQELPALAKYLTKRGASQVFLSYDGPTSPRAYGIVSDPLPPAPSGSGVPAFYPLNPLPGLYVISASNLVGATAAPFDPDTFGFFRTRQPAAQIGHSLFVYEIAQQVVKSGDWLAQCASPKPVARVERLQALTGIGNLRQFYFDCRQSLPIPEDAGWVVIPAGIDPVVDLGAPDFVARAEDGTPTYNVWKVAQRPAAPPSTIALPQTPLPLPIADQLELLGYQLDPGPIEVGKTLVIKEWWRMRQAPQTPFVISARLIAADSAGTKNESAGGDALGVRTDDWQPGMLLIQQHTIPLPTALPPGDYWVAVGLLDPATGRYLPVSESGGQIIDRIYLARITVKASAR